MSAAIKKQLLRIWWRGRKLLRQFTNPHRVRAYMFYATHPSYPLFTPRATAFLSVYLKPGMKVFEWGAGRSTPFFAERGADLVSVEHDQAWYERVQSQLRGRRLQNVTLRFVPVVAGVESPDYTNYIHVIDEYLDNYFDVVVVDGRERSACFLEAIPKVKPGGLLVLDDSQRDRYAPAMTVVEDMGWTPHHLMFGFNRTSVWKKP